MTLYLRLWERTTQFFIQYHQMTQEKPSGSIRMLFARYEFQTTKKNVRDLHIVLWTHESNHYFNIRHNICGSSTHLFNDFKVDFNRHNSFISSEDHLTQLIEDSMTLLMHSCKNCGFRCHKKATVLVNLCVDLKSTHPAKRLFFMLSIDPAVKKLGSSCISWI